MRRIPGSHEPNTKNRSSKQLVPLTKYRPAIRSMSNEALTAMNSKEALKERTRRAKKAEKKAAKAKQ